MRIGIPVWEDRVSPVMDTAQRLVIVEVIDSRAGDRRQVDLPKMSPAGLAGAIGGAGVRLLICGAISRQLERHLCSRGVETLPWIRGTIDNVIDAFVGGQIEREGFDLPGCAGRCGRRRQGRRQGRRHRTNEEDL